MDGDVAGRVGVVLVAAGKGTRMKHTVSKQFVQIGTKPMLIHALMAFEQVEEVDEIVLVTGKDDIERCHAFIKQYGLRKVKIVVAGGAERQQSVFHGLQQLSKSTEWVLVHDAARPFIQRERILACLLGAQQTGAAVLAVPMKDTVKVIDDEGFVRSTPERKTLWAVQTPQAFHVSALFAAHQAAERDGFLGTDDAMLMERTGARIQVVEGDESNQKITTQDDLVWAQWWIERQQDSIREGST